MKKFLYYIKGGMVRGRICTDPRGGFVWVPFSTATQRSRKAWPTPEASIAGRISGGLIIEAVNLAQAQSIAVSSNGPQVRGKTEGRHCPLKTDLHNIGSTPITATI